MCVCVYVTMKKEENKGDNDGRKGSNEQTRKTKLIYILG